MPTRATSTTAAVAHYIETRVALAELKDISALLATLHAGRVAEVTTLALVGCGLRSVSLRAANDIKAAGVLAQLERLVALGTLS